MIIEQPVGSEREADRVAAGMRAAGWGATDWSYHPLNGFVVKVDAEGRDEDARRFLLSLCEVER